MSAFSRTTLLLPLLIALAGVVFACGAPARAQTGEPLIRVATVDDAITAPIADYIDRALAEAEDDNAAALIIQLNTPGGDSEAMDDIIADILASEIPVVVYVSPTGARAASAGVYITYAAHVAAMAPGTNIGSATPVMIGSTGSDASDESMNEKIKNDAVAQITNLANLRGRNVEWAQSAVLDAANITADEALALGVIDLIAPDLASLVQMIDGRAVTVASGSVTIETSNAAIEDADMSWVEQLEQFLANPTLAYLLITFGMIGLFVELSGPGVTIPGLLGSISLVLGLVGLGSLPVNWLGVGLMLLAFVLFVVDIFVPSLGLLTIGGLACFLIGSNILIASDTPDELQISKTVIWTVTALIAATAFILGAIIVRSQFRKPKTGKTAMVGQVGVARTDLNPNGTVLVFGEIWSASAAEGVIPAGSSIVVDRVSGMNVTVRLADAEVISPDRDEVGDRRMVIPVQ